MENLDKKTIRKQKLSKKFAEGSQNIFDWVCGIFIAGIGGFAIVFTIVTLAIRLV